FRSRFLWISVPADCILYSNSAVARALYHDLFSGDYFIGYTRFFRIAPSPSKDRRRSTGRGDPVGRNKSYVHQRLFHRNTKGTVEDYIAGFTTAEPDNADSGLYRNEILAGLLSRTARPSTGKTSG